MERGPDDLWGTTAPADARPLPGPSDDPQQGLAAADVRLDWCDQMDAPAATDKAKTKAADKRSWTQPELNTVMETEIAKYSEAIAAARKGGKVARREVRKLFGGQCLPAG